MNINPNNALDFEEHLKYDPEDVLYSIHGESGGTDLRILMDVESIPGVDVEMTIADEWKGAIRMNQIKNNALFLMVGLLSVVLFALEHFAGVMSVHSAVQLSVLVVADLCFLLVLRKKRGSFNACGFRPLECPANLLFYIPVFVAASYCLYGGVAVSGRLVDMFLRVCIAFAYAFFISMLFFGFLFNTWDHRENDATKPIVITTLLFGGFSALRSPACLNPVSVFCICSALGVLYCFVLHFTNSISVCLIAEAIREVASVFHNTDPTRTQHADYFMWVSFLIIFGYLLLMIRRCKDNNAIFKREEGYDDGY